MKKRNRENDKKSKCKLKHQEHYGHKELQILTNQNNNPANNKI